MAIREPDSRINILTEDRSKEQIKCGPPSGLSGLELKTKTEKKNKNKTKTGIFPSFSLAIHSTLKTF